MKVKVVPAARLTAANLTAGYYLNRRPPVVLDQCPALLPWLEDQRPARCDQVVPLRVTRAAKRVIGTCPRHGIFEVRP